MLYNIGLRIMFGCRRLCKAGWNVVRTLKLPNFIIVSIRTEKHEGLTTKYSQATKSCLKATKEIKMNR